MATPETAAAIRAMIEPTTTGAYNTRDGFYIPERMMPALRRWVECFELPGDFLTKVLENDLKLAVGYADDENKRNLPAYVRWLYNEAPADCWGSPEKVSDWQAKGEWQKKLAADRAKATGSAS